MGVFLPLILADGTLSGPGRWRQSPRRGPEDFTTEAPRAREEGRCSPSVSAPFRGMALDMRRHIAMISLWTGGNQAGSRGPQGRTKAQPKGLTFSLQSMNRFVQSMVSAREANKAERTNMRSRAYPQYFGGLIAGIGLGFLICRACQAKGWLDVATSPLFIVGGGIMVAAGVALAQLRPRQAPRP